MLPEKLDHAPITTTSLFWWSNVLVSWSKCQTNSHRGVLQKFCFAWLAASLLGPLLAMQCLATWMLLWAYGHMILDASSSGCCLLIRSKLGHNIVLAVNVVMISQFLHHRHSLLYWSVFVNGCVNLVYPLLPKLCLPYSCSGCFSLPK